MVASATTSAARTSFASAEAANISGAPTAERCHEVRMARLDPHSVADDSQPVVTRFNWEAQVDFESKRLNCTVTLALSETVNAETVLDLDTRGLEVESVTSSYNPL